MTKQQPKDSYRISHKQLGYATIWPISEHLSSVQWDDLSLSYTVLTEQVERNLADGIWVKQSDKTELFFKLNIDTSEAQVAVDNLVEKSNTILERIKSFTTGTGHDVFVTEGIYKVYRAHEDMPYVAQNEEELIKVIDALIVLDEAETE